MKNYSITKQQVLQLENFILKENVNKNLRIWFPDAFKKELELNKWYKGTKRNFLVNYQGDNMENYGFWEFQGFKNNIAFGSYWSNECVEATPQEVEIALIAEAKKRGFIDGAKFKSFEHGNPIRTVRESGRLNFNMITNHLLISTPESEWDNYQSNPAIFEKGKWAQIIPQEKQVIPMEKALKIIAKKLKTSPDNIEIK